MGLTLLLLLLELLFTETLTARVLAGLRAARAWAAMAGRSFVTPDDIQALIHPVLAHRLLLTNEARLSGVTADGVLDQIAAQLPVPPAAGDEFHGA